MIGVDRSTGRALSGDAHLAQSIGDILATPIGTRTMRRDYGSLLPELIDQPQNDATRLSMLAATASALRRWEIRLRVTRVVVRFDPAGSATIGIEGYRTDRPEPNALARFTIPLRAARSAAPA